MSVGDAKPVAFYGGAVGLVAVLLLIAVESTLTRLLSYAWEFGPSLPVVGIPVLSVVVSLSILVLGVVSLRRVENVGLEEIGLGRELVVPAVISVAGFFAGINVLAAGLAIASGNATSIGYHWTVSPAEALFQLFVMLVVAGLVEELLFRGYLQTKLIASLGGPRLIRIGFAILVASLLFAAYHVPRILTDGAPDGMTAVAYLTLLTVNGIGYGLLYEWTHNLYIPILVHMAGNAPGTMGILFVTPVGWPQWASVGYQLAYVGVVIGVILLYRRWAVSTGTMPIWTDRTEANSRVETAEPTS